MLRRTLFALVVAYALAQGQEIRRPYVLLVSVDGFRYDYAALHGAPNLTRFGKEGVRAEGLIPQYPSSTFPNHYSIATGLFPAHHGIVDNTFFDPARREVYRSNGLDGSWYGGTPLWVLAEQQGVRTASFFWVGSEAEIQGRRPREYRVFEDTLPNEERVRQVIDWFRRPEALRPHLVTLYFSDVDHAGHDTGPKSAATKKAVQNIDALLGRLLEGLRTTGTPVNVFIVSDHGMIEAPPPIRVGAVTDFAGFEIPSLRGSQIMLYSSDAALARSTVERVNRNATGYSAYLREETPEAWHYRGNARVGDVVIAAAGSGVVAIDPANGQTGAGPKGFHGPDAAAVPEMRGIFYAGGPDLKSGVTIPAFQNVDIYPLIARLLKLKTGSVDGSLDTLQPILK
ncbi:MAG: ectonucleotide pyrophosphatase/phosphodiesterase [Acidobacteriota bacterium]